MTQPREDAPDMQVSLQLEVLKSKLKFSSEEKEILSSRLDVLEENVEKQREEKEEILSAMHRKLDEKVNILKKSESTLRIQLDELKDALKTQKEIVASQLDTIEKLKKDHSEEIRDLTAKLGSLEHFIAEKTMFEDEISKLKSDLRAKSDMHTEYVIDSERKRVQEEQKIRKELQVKIKEAKDAMLASSREQVDDTIRKILNENDRLKAELQYQSLEVARIMKTINHLENKNRDLSANNYLLQQELESNLHQRAQEHYAHAGEGESKQNKYGK